MYVARRSAAQILATMPNIDAVFGPYYLFMHVWTDVFGTSELAFRAPSILAMAAAVGLTGELGRRLFDPVVGTAAGLILCIIPAATRYAQEARPYAIGCLLAVLATVLLYRGLADPRPARWVAYGGTVVLLGASHLVALTLLGAHAIVVLRHPGRFGISAPSGGPGTGRQQSLVRAWLPTVAVALACLAPLAYLGLGQRDAQLSWVPPLTAHDVASAPAAVIGSADTAWLLVGLALLAARRRLELAVLAVVPVAAVAAFSVIADPLWVPRYLLIVLAPLALAAAVGAAGEAGMVRLVVVSLVLAGTAYPEQRRVREVDAHNGGNYRQAAQVIAGLDRPGDAIVVQDGRSTRAAMDYYLRDDPGRPADVLLDRSAADVDRLSATERTDVATRLGAARRVWLVVMGRPADPLRAKPEVWTVLRDGFDRAGLWRFSRTTVALYRHRPTQRDPGHLLNSRHRPNG